MEAAEVQTLAAAALTSAAEARAAAAKVCAAAVEEAQIRAEAESTKWHGVSRKFFDSFGFPGDVVTKARIFDECMKKPEAVSATKILHMLVHFSGRVENLLKEIRSTFQLSDQGHEAGPSEQRPKLVPGPSRSEPPSPPTATPAAPPTGAPFASTPRMEATPHQSEATSMPSIPDPTRQEPIPDSLNTDDILSLHQWGTEDLLESATPATGSRGSTDPVIRITPGSVIHSQRRTGSVQTNLFGGTPEDPAAGFRRHMRQLVDKLQAETGEEWRISGDEDDPVTENPVEEDAAEEEDAGEEEDEEEEDEDEEEEEDPGYGDDDKDDDSPPASSHRPVTRSTPKKKPVSQPKQKAYRNKSGPGSSSRKRTRNRR